jgi:hypothetical protein
MSKKKDIKDTFDAIWKIIKIIAIIGIIIWFISNAFPDMGGYTPIK